MQTGIVDLPGYNNNEDCNGGITVAAGSRILLKFESFEVRCNLENLIYAKNFYLLQTEGSSSSSFRDYLEVYDGPSSSDTLIAKLGYTTIPQPIFSSGNSLYLRFKSDYSVSKDGFKAYFMRGKYLLRY